MANDKELNVKATGVIAIAVMLSRVLGLVREVLFNALFGTSAMGIFLIAFRAPNLLRDLFAEGALSISFVAVFAKKVESEGDQSAWKLASKMLTMTTVFMSICSLLGIIFSEQLISVLAPGFSPEDTKTTVFLTQVMFPFILLVSLAALVMGMLNSKNVFGVPALASSFFNIGSIIGGAFFGWLIDPTFGVKALTGLAIGTLIGGLLQFAIQLPSLRTVGFRFRPDFHWHDSGIRTILILTLPAIIAASAVQVNVLINSCFASYVGKGAVTWLNSAFRLMQFPIGVFGVAVATITLPVLSRIAATTDHEHFGPTLGRALRLAVFLTIPSAVGLWFFAKPIISLIYQHGKFNAIDSGQTALALQFYALGLVAYSCIKVLSPGFYAIDKKWTPMIVSFISIVLNIFFNYWFIFVLKIGHSGLAISTTVCATFNFLTLYLFMRQWHNLQTMRFIGTIFYCAIASVALAAVCWVTLTCFPQYIYHSLLSIRIISLLLAITCSGFIYLIICLAFRVEAASDMFNALRRRFGPLKRGK